MSASKGRGGQVPWHPCSCIFSPDVSSELEGLLKQREKCMLKSCCFPCTMKNTCEVKSVPGKNTLRPSCSSFLKYLLSKQVMPYVRMPRVESVRIYCPLRDSLSSRQGAVHSAEAGVAAITSLAAQAWVSMVKLAQSRRTFRRKWLGAGRHWRVSSWRGNKGKGSNVQSGW